jgi:hypothetical protein
VLNPNFETTQTRKRTAGFFVRESSRNKRLRVEMPINSNKQICIDDLSAGMKRSANWRRGLQAKFPDDSRNGRAAERLDRLASEISDLSDESWKRLEQHYNWASAKWSDAVSQASRQVAFRNVDDLPAFVERLVSILSQPSIAA